MADSPAVRQARYRRHRTGDHSLCRPGCKKPMPLSLVLDPDAGPLDIRMALETLARRLEAAHAADPSNAMVARELRITLLAIPAEEAADPMAELRAFSARVS